MRASIEAIGGKRLSADADLCETWLSNAIEEMKSTNLDHAMMLVTSVDQAFIAGKLCQRFGLQYIALPESMIKSDSWAVVGEFSHIWSPGA